MWWRLVGSAVEHAAGCATGVETIDFRTLFLAQDDEDEDDNALAEALVALRTWVAERLKAVEEMPQSTKEEKKARMVAKQKWADGKFSAADLAPWINNTGMYPNPVRDAYRVFHAKIEPGDRVSPIAIGIRLKTKVGEPVKGNGETLILQKEKSASQGKAPYIFRIEAKADTAPTAKPEGESRGSGEVGGVVP